jgi:hypothetical protein
MPGAQSIGRCASGVRAWTRNTFLCILSIPVGMGDGSFLQGRKGMSGFDRVDYQAIARRRRSRLR